MKKILIIANTYYQLIMALQLNETIYKNDEVTLLLSDHSNGSKEIVGRIQQLNIFYGVKYIETKYSEYKKTFLSKIQNVFENIFTSNNRYKCKLEGLGGFFYDEIIAFNINIIIYNFFSIIYEFNPSVVVSGYEEGVLSYNMQTLEFKGSKIISKLRVLFGKKSFEQSLRNFYCFYPQLYEGLLNPVKIPTISKKSNIVNTLKYIFLIDNKDNKYSRKYIYFSSIYDFEGGSCIGEFTQVLKIAQLVGKDNLIVKIHPRDSRSVYKDSGLFVDSNSSVPWEVLQLTIDFSNSIFISAISGSVLAGSLMTTAPVKTFYTYKLCNIDGNPRAKKSIRSINNLLSNDSMRKMLQNIKIVTKIEEILSIDSLNNK